MTAADVWTANKFIREPSGDGGSPRIPTLKVRNQAAQRHSSATTRERPGHLPRCFSHCPRQELKIMGIFSTQSRYRILHESALAKSDDISRNSPLTRPPVQTAFQI